MIPGKSVECSITLKPSILFAVGYRKLLGVRWCPVAGKSFLLSGTRVKLYDSLVFSSGMRSRCKNNDHSLFACTPRTSMIGERVM
jgi:hypothetical protein